jgi:hypothetical protein
MDQLIDVIRAATATDATKEAKAAGVQACRTIAAALDTEPGKPIVLPGTPPQRPLAGVSIDQVLDLMIARLTTIANTRETNDTALEVPHPPEAVAVPAPSRTGLRVPMVARSTLPQPAGRIHAPNGRPATRPATAARSTAAKKP